MTERDIQIKLFNWRLKHGHSLIVPNTQCYGYESDLLSVSRRGFSYDHEIKLTRADFKNEMKAFCYGKNTVRLSPRQHSKTFSNSKYAKHSFLQFALNGNPSPVYCPNYFYFVSPVNVINVDELPDYAGLIFINPLEVILKAPCLHKTVINDVQRNKLAIGLMYRFWNNVKVKS